MKNTLSILVLFTLLQSSAQNLVPNPSFEDNWGCPDNWAQMHLVDQWEIYKASPDYYHSCSPVSGFATPSNEMGYQFPASGDAYLGMIFYYVPDESLNEVTGVQLIQPLIIGQTYYISMKAVLEYNNIYQVCCGQDKIGVKFSTIPYNGFSIPATDNFAHMYTNSVISDTTNWTTISGSFVADSAYSYLMIGNFFDNANTQTVNLNPGEISYYYLDDVCVSADSLTCLGNVGLNELSNPNKKLVRIVDAIGRETENTPNTLLIYVYSDGTTEKVYRVK